MSSSTSERIEIPSEISPRSSSSSKSRLPSSRPTNVLKGEQQQQRNLSFRRRFYPQRSGKKTSIHSLINSTSTSKNLLASRSRFPSSSFSSLFPSFTSRSNSRYRTSKIYTPKTKTKLNNSHRSQLKRTLHRTASKKVHRTRTRGRGKKDLG